ncbi:MAG: L-threonylcarbamoyladenylate synthase [Spirochaetia bacterium]
MYSSESDIRSAAEHILDGKVVVFPTETVYGLGANALDPCAVGAIFEIKSRPADNPLIVHLATPDEVGRVAQDVGTTARRLLAEFSPGPLTVVLAASPELPHIVTAGLDTVAVRIPAHPVAQGLIMAAGVPVAAPSANRSGEPSPTTVEMARRSLGLAPAAYLDGGPCEIGLESTVVAVMGDEVHILRPGAVTETDILAVLPDVTVHAEGAERTEARAVPAAPASPGTRHRHYQPKAEVCLYDNLDQLREFLVRPAEQDGVYGVIVPAQKLGCRPRVAGRAEQSAAVVRSYADLREYARHLYGWFDEFDESSVSVVFAHLPRGTGLATALRDRLIRASGGRRIRDHSP